MHASELSECAVLARLCFLRVAREELQFFTNFQDPRLSRRRDGTISEHGILFHFSAWFIAVFRSVGIAEILEDTEYHAGHAKQFLSFSEDLEWTCRLEFVWFNLNRSCKL